MQILVRGECDGGAVLAVRDGSFGVGDTEERHIVPGDVSALVRFQPRPGKEKLLGNLGFCRLPPQFLRSETALSVSL